MPVQGEVATQYSTTSKSVIPRRKDEQEVLNLFFQKGVYLHFRLHAGSGKLLKEFTENAVYEKLMH